MIMQWEKTAWSAIGKGASNDTYIVKLRICAMSDVTPWEWADYPEAKLVYNYTIEVDGSIVFVDKRIDAIGTEGDLINWYGSDNKGDTTSFDILAAEAIEEYQPRPVAIAYRNELIHERLVQEIKEQQNTIERTREYYTERRQELAKEEKEDIEDEAAALAAKQARLEQFQSDVRMRE